MVWTRHMNLQEYAKALHDMMQLQMWYAVHAVRQGKVFTEVVSNLTEVYTYCNFYKQEVAPEHNTDFDNIIQLLETTWHSVGDYEFPAASWELLKPYLTTRIEKDLIMARKNIENSYAGFTFEYHREYFGPAKPEFLTLHFRNYFAPDTPFNHRQELTAALLKIVDEAEHARPDVDKVQCATWLNNIEPFYSLFPNQWLKTSYVCPFEGNAGWWGQFIDRTGQLHKGNVAKFMKTGQFPYPNRHCRCGIVDLKSHLCI